jgi:hypothetical protein
MRNMALVLGICLVLPHPALAKRHREVAPAIPLPDALQISLLISDVGAKLQCIATTPAGHVKVV